MGTYTANKNLFMPTVGEQGWGTMVNGNFTTIDNFLKPITVSGSTYTFTGNHVGNQSGGSISATSISNSGTLTQTGTSTFTGKVTANGGIGTTALTTSSTITSTGLITGNGGVKGNLTGNVTGNITGNVTGLLFLKGNVQTSGDVVYATCAATSTTSEGHVHSNRPMSITPSGTYSITFPTNYKITHGVYCRKADLTGTTSPKATTRTVTVIPVENDGMDYGFVYYRIGTSGSWTNLGHLDAGSGTSATVTVNVGNTVQFYCGNSCKLKVTVNAAPTYYVKIATP